MPALDQIAICNAAVAHLPAAPISSIEENSLEARECRRFYWAVIADALEGPHDWSFANVREALALKANTRGAEWLWAYHLPSNLGSPIRVLPDFLEPGIMVPVPLPGEPYAETWPSTYGTLATDYVIDGGTLYSNFAGAVLEYVTNAPSNLDVPRLFTRAVELDLASRICVPIKKDQDRETKLIQLAEAAWQRAMADDNNRHPVVSGQYSSEVLAARSGYGCG